MIDPLLCKAVSRCIKMYQEWKEITSRILTLTTLTTLTSWRSRWHGDGAFPGAGERDRECRDCHGGRIGGSFSLHAIFIKRKRDEGSQGLWIGRIKYSLERKIEHIPVLMGEFTPRVTLQPQSTQDTQVISSLSTDHGQIPESNWVQLDFERRAPSPSKLRLSSHGRDQATGDAWHVRDTWD